MRWILAKVLTITLGLVSVVYGLVNGPVYITGAGVGIVIGAFVSSSEPVLDLKLWSKLTLWAVLVFMGTVLSTKVIHESAHLVVGTAFGFRPVEINMFTLDHAFVVWESPDQDSWRWFLTVIAGAVTNIAAGVYAARRWNTLKQERWWPELGFVGGGFTLGALTNALYLMPMVNEGIDYTLMEKFLLEKGLGMEAVWAIGLTLLVVALYHLVYFVRVQLEVTILD